MKDARSQPKTLTNHLFVLLGKMDASICRNAAIITILNGSKSTEGETKNGREDKSQPSEDSRTKRRIKCIFHSLQRGSLVASAA